MRIGPAARLFVAGIVCLAVPAFADEVDDVLALKAKNQNRVRRFSAEFSVETDQPRTVPNPKTVKFRYRMTATKTLEFVSHGKAKMFSRMEEDVNSDGLPLETRLYDDSGKQTVQIKVKKHRKVSGIPVMEAMETVSRTPVGEITSRTSCMQIEVEASE